MSSTLTEIIYLHYRVAAKMALEILRYTICRVRLGRLMSLPFEVSKFVYAALGSRREISKYLFSLGEKLDIPAPR